MSLVFPYTCFFVYLFFFFLCFVSSLVYLLIYSLVFWSFRGTLLFFFKQRQADLVFFSWGLGLVIGGWGQKLWEQIRAQEYTEMWQGRGLAKDSDRESFFPTFKDSIHGPYQVDNGSTWGSCIINYQKCLVNMWCNISVCVYKYVITVKTWRLQWLVNMQGSGSQ